MHTLTVIWESEVLQEQQTVTETRKQREASSERVIAEKQFEHGRLVVSARAPVRVRHGELVQIRE